MMWKQIKIGYYALLWLTLMTAAACSSPPADKDIHLIPEPVMVKKGESQLSLKGGFAIVADTAVLKKLIPVISNEMFMLTGVKHNPGSTHETAVRLRLNPKMKKEQYHLTVSRKGVLLEGGSYQSVAEGSVTLLQLINDNKSIPEIEVRDTPASAYRGLMIDVARNWHSIETLEQIVELCRWYKIKYLQLHLTDDQSFTFPSKDYPLLPTSNRHYTRGQLIALNEYAIQRGVIIIPEFDIPGHSSAVINAMPKLFGIRDWKKNSNTLSMAKDTVYHALNKIIGDMISIFPQSPYFHIGADEVFMGGMEDDPDTKRYMARHGLRSMDDLYRSFIVRVAAIVKSYGKKPVVWNGFQKDGDVKIPTDVMVMEYLPFDYPPQDLIDDGYKIVNASFKPLYVVNNQVWDVNYIYDQWNIFNWQIPRNDLPGEYKGIDVKPANQVVGASMSAWEQGERKEIPSLRRRLAAMSERVWSSRKRDMATFMNDLNYTDEKFGRILSPIILSVKGLTHPDPDNDVQWFDSTITVQVSAALPDTKLHYTLDGGSPDRNAPEYSNPLTFDKSMKLRIQAYDINGQKVGSTVNGNYLLKPVQVEVKGTRSKDTKPYSGEEAKFDDAITITLKSKRGDHIRYSLKGSLSATESPVYKIPIKVDHTTYLTAQAYDAQNNPIGLPSQETFIKVRKETSLTTNKPVSSSTDQIDPRLAKLATDGEISVNDYWDDKAGGWVEIDLKKQERIARFKVYTFWDNYRYYQYIIEVSSDGNKWRKVVDFSHNTTIAASNGYINNISPTKARYIKITMLYNSANPIMHLVELSAFSSVKDSIN